MKAWIYETKIIAGRNIRSRSVVLRGRKTVTKQPKKYREQKKLNFGHHIASKWSQAICFMTIKHEAQRLIRLFRNGRRTIEYVRLIFSFPPSRWGRKCRSKSKRLALSLTSSTSNASFIPFLNGYKGWKMVCMIRWLMHFFISIPTIFSARLEKPNNGP